MTRCPGLAKCVCTNCQDQQRCTYGDPLPPPKPIDMVLYCPACGTQHIDAPDKPDLLNRPLVNLDRWTNPPHRSHLCSSCGYIWRPADVPTNGVQAVKTKGKADSPIVTRDQFGRTSEMIRFQADLDAGDDE